MGTATARDREAALLALGTCYHGTGDVRVGRLLARAVRDVSEPKLIRRGAYAALHFLCGLPLPPAAVTPTAFFQVPESADLSFVDSFLGRSR